MKILTKKNVTYVLLTALAVWVGIDGIPRLVSMLKTKG